MGAQAGILGIALLRVRDGVDGDADCRVRCGVGLPGSIVTVLVYWVMGFYFPLLIVETAVVVEQRG